MKEALRRQESGEAVAIPIILRPCAWQDAPFGQLQALPQDGCAITLWENRDVVTLEVARGVMQVVHELSNQRESIQLNQVSGINEEEICENILDKLSDYHKEGKRVKVSQVINWFKRKYGREQILQALIRMQHDKIIQLDEQDIGRATEIKLLKKNY
jgi:hypothetical protein